MRLDPPPKHTMRVHELAKELGWPPAQLVDELRRRGEWVKSAMSTIEAPVVRAIRRDFAAADPPANPEHSLEPALYGDSADLALPTEPPGETFAEALARVKAEPPLHQKSATSKTGRWRPPVLQALLDEVIAQRPEHLHPNGECFGWELKKAEKMHLRWTAARLDGLAGEDPSSSSGSGSAAGSGLTWPPSCPARASPRARRACDWDTAGASIHGWTRSTSASAIDVSPVRRRSLRYGSGARTPPPADPLVGC